MKKMLSLSCRLSLLCAAGVWGAHAAHAQITTNALALDHLGSTQPTPTEAPAATQEARQATQQLSLIHI